MITYRFWSEFQIVGAANENDLQAYFFMLTHVRL